MKEHPGDERDLVRYRRQASVAEETPQKPELPVNQEIARAIEKVVRERHEDDSWLDVADALVVELAAAVCFVPKADYDRMVTRLRALNGRELNL